MSKDYESMISWMSNSTHANAYGDYTDADAMVDGIITALQQAQKIESGELVLVPPNRVMPDGWEMRVIDYAPDETKG